ncbi:MAG: elongation factor G [Chloroflexi bacterium]|nr:MAG: elongation factor G [Chloroflexota bacterium]PIE81218.1 MAG: elongation factor G [Chloroflexota bacterium]
MKEYQTSNIRNIALVGHNGSGKTTFVERALFNTGATNRMGSVQAGTAVMDFEEEEIARNSSVSVGLAPVEFQGKKLNLLDTPGFMDFVGEVNSSLYVADTALVFVEAVSGVEVGTEIVRQAATALDIPQIILINKMDRENVRVSRVMESINNNLGGNFVNMQLPIGEGTDFKGVIDLLKMEARIGEKSEVAPIPDDMADDAEEARMALVEAAAEGDDVLMEKFFEDEELTPEEIVTGLKGAMAQGLVTPIIYSAPEAGIVIEPALEVLVALGTVPNEHSFTADKDGSEETFDVSDDSPLAAFIFKTREDAYGKTSYIRVFGGVLESDSRYWAAQLDSEVRVGSLQVVTGKETDPVAKLHAGDIGVVVKLGDAGTNDTLCAKNNQLKLAPVAQPNPIASVAIHPKTQSDVAKLSQSLNRLVAEDPTLNWYTEKVTRETILSGMGTTHLDIAVKKAQSKFGVSLETTIPKVPYRETITKTATADYTHKKQTGGAGQYGRVFLRLESLDDDSDFEFDSEIFGGAVSAPFVAATEKGCRQALESGPIAGYTVVGVKAIIFDGKEHPVDSKEIAFQTAGRECFKKAMMQAGPILLEPIYKATVTVPADYMGDIMGDMNSRRARVLGIDQEGTKSIVQSEVPLAEMQTYAQDLRSMTQGRGVYAMEFSNYGRVPSHLQEQIAAQAAKEREEEG